MTTIFVMRAARGCTHLLIDTAENRVGEGITGWVAEGNTYKADAHEQISADPRHIGKYDKAVWGCDAHQYHSMVAERSAEPLQMLLETTCRKTGRRVCPEGLFTGLPGSSGRRL